MKLLAFFLSLGFLLALLSYKKILDFLTSKSSKKEEEEEKPTKKEEAKKHDKHDDHGSHDDHGHGGGHSAKPAKVLSAIEKIFMWILLIPLILILNFIIIPSLFPEFWTSLGGPILWEGKLFMPIVVCLILSILLSIINGHIGPILILVGFLGILGITKLILSKSENKQVEIPVKKSNSLWYYFNDRDVIEVPINYSYTMYPKGGCIHVIDPCGNEWDDCPGKILNFPDCHYDTDNIIFRIRKKDNSTEAVEIRRH